MPKKNTGVAGKADFPPGHYFVALLDIMPVMIVEVAVEREQVVGVLDTDVIPVSAGITTHAHHRTGQGRVDRSAQGDAIVNPVVAVGQRIPLGIFPKALGGRVGIGLERMEQF